MDAGKVIFSEEEQKWRVIDIKSKSIRGFGIGSTCKKGDRGYMPATVEGLYEHFTTPFEAAGGFCYKKENVIKKASSVILCQSGVHVHVSVGRGEWTATTLEEAKQMAIDFAEGVS